eukprot:scaffold26259_cov57-Attheya_sp.AAC.2
MSWEHRLWRFDQTTPLFAFDCGRIVCHDHAVIASCDDKMVDIYTTGTGIKYFKGTVHWPYAVTQ